MKKSQRLLSGILTFCLVFSLLPFTAQAKSETYWETAKDNVPLRYDYGAENDIVSRVSDKGVVAVEIQEIGHWAGIFTCNTWYKVRIPEGYTTNGLHGDFWVYSGNLTKHKHTLAAGACTASGCTYEKTIETLEKKTTYLEVTKDQAKVRKLPYCDADEVQRMSEGAIITATATVENYKGSLWYKLKSGSYIYSANVKEASAEKVEAVNNSIHNAEEKEDTWIGPDPVVLPPNSDEFLTYDKTICLKHEWSMGVCVNCDEEWPLLVTPVNGTYKTNIENATAKDIPYKQGKVMKTYPTKGTVVNITGVHENSAGSIWYRTEEGYWIFRVDDASMTDAYFSSSGYTFSSTSDTHTPTLVIKPAKAVIAKRTWASSNPAIATVSSSGKITPTGTPGKTTITCTVESAEGSVKIAEMQVTMPEAVTLETWSYNNKKFNYDLALECSEYMSLAYPAYDYSYVEGDLIVFKTDKSSKTPKNLIRLLQSRGMDYQVSSNYNNRTHTNSPYTLATKYVNYNGVVTPVVYVIILGSAGRAGWEGNMMITGTSYDEMSVHYTFNESANNILQGLQSYIKQYTVKPHIVITGHSRGAAVGNLLAEKLNKNSKLYNKIYAYCFATPNSTKEPVAYANVFNICNTRDLVPYIPFSTSGWDYEKHGTTYAFNTTTLYASNKTFKKYANLQVKRSTGINRDTPDYEYHNGSPSYIQSYASGIWSTVSQYYKHTRDYPCDLEAYEYFKEGLASAASMKDIDDVAILADHLHSSDHGSKCVFRPLSWFFACNGISADPFAYLAAFGDSHEAHTYHAAMLAKVYDTSDSTDLFSLNDYGNGTVDLNEEEYDYLNAFFTQDENQLMLELAGWDVADPATWTGVLWDLDGHIISLDLSYLNLTGWLDVSCMTRLETLNIDGNGISMLALGEIETLTDLSCSFNSLGSLDVTNCENLQNLSCSYNILESLDVSGMSNLQQLNCFGNELSSLDLENASQLSQLDCSNNNLTGLDISTNTSLSTFFCDNNFIVESQNPGLSSLVADINDNGGTAYIGCQQYIPGYDFNAEEVANLTEFANSALNLEKLGWDLSDPWSWTGVQWKIYGEEYHVSSLAFDDLDLEGDLNLPDAVYLESISCENSSLSTLNLSGCTSVTSVDCYNAGLSSLELSGCTGLVSLNCNENYLEVESVESSLSQIGLQTGLVSYENQNIGADEETFDAHEREVLISFMSTGSNAEALGWDWNWPGTWEGIIWTKDEEGTFRVNRIDFAELPVTGALDLTGFDYLEDFNFSGTDLESVTLPDCITSIPAYAFYNSAVETVYLCDGVTSVKERAFAYCKNLRTIVLPSTVTDMEYAAFYGCSALEHAVFLGDEPLEVGADIFSGSSSTFAIDYFASAAWSAESSLLNNYLFNEVSTSYLMLPDSSLALTTDSSFNLFNNYSGDDVEVTLITNTPGKEQVCMLAVYNEEDKLSSVVMQNVSLNDYLTTITFEDVRIQYAGEEACQIKVFLCAADGSLAPVTQCTYKVLSKPTND